MSIPLDRLYCYIESIAQSVRRDKVLIYRFFPNGSKKIEDLSLHSPCDALEYLMSPQIYCNDQEPLNYQYYQTIDITNHPNAGMKRVCKDAGVELYDTNFRVASGLYDKAILLHSEQRSCNVDLYKSNKFIPAYYWSHAIIAIDWFRYAQYYTCQKLSKYKFLIYNRAWSGTREYRLKFAELLVQHNLQAYCNMKTNVVDPALKIHYTDYTYANSQWQPDIDLGLYYDQTHADSSASADFDSEDYNQTDIEIVLETLFDDSRLHLTEKILRPIALGQPFILAATHGSLQYLKNYGFKTFSSVINEDYDLIVDPYTRLQAIARLISEIANWPADTYFKKLKELNAIAEYNRRHFFSAEFFNTISNELKTNLSTALHELENTCSGEIIEKRKKYSHIDQIRNGLLGKLPGNTVSRKHIATMVAKARQYYLRNLNKE